MNLLNRLYNANLFSEKAGLENMRRALALLGNPEKRVKFIHIAGSNGKGSVATKIAAGLKGDVGLFTSPHIFRFNERIQINNNEIPDEDLNHLLVETFALIDNHGIPATFFEITTLIALQYFAKWKVNWAVLETGLGGRLDATNVVTPELSVITSISLEHTEVLGNTIEAIAKEKAGIIKRGVPVVLGPTVPIVAPLMHRVEGEFETYNDENRAIAKAALNHFGIQEVPEVLPPCRMETHYGKVPVIFDVAHNPDGLIHLISALKQKFNSETFHFVCGFSQNKNVESCLKEIIPHATHISVTGSQNSRLSTPDKICSLIPQSTSHESFDDPKIAAEATLLRAIKHSEPLVICGSFYIMERALQYGTESQQMA